MTEHWRTRLAGTQWAGGGELWLDPLGDKADRCDCSLRIEADAIHYTWSHEGQAKEGSFSFEEGGVTWSDSFHQPKPTSCADVPNAWGHFTVELAYDAPSGPPWGWRIKLSERPSGELVLQMVNITPWGEEGRAVRMIIERAEG